MQRSVLHEGSRSFCRALSIGLIMGFCISQIFVPLSLQQFQSKLDVLKFRNKFNANESRKLNVSIYRDETIAKKLYKEVRVLCWIMTSPEYHETRAIHIKNTWGKRCNKLLFMSTQLDEKLDSIALPVNETYDYLWGKTKAAFQYIYENHFDEADWFFKADDDTYAILENMRYFLYSYSPETPIYFGCKYNVIVNQGYMSGGAGYVLSKEAVRRFVEEALPNPELCKQDDTGAEDAEIGACLQNVQVIAGDSRDSQNRARFFPFPPEDHLIGPIDKTFWYYQNLYYKSDEGLDCCSDTTISFHYIDPNHMYVLDYLIYQLKTYGINYPPTQLKTVETPEQPKSATTTQNSKV